MPRYREGWKFNKLCKVCAAIKDDETLFTRIMESSQYMKGGEPLTEILEDYKDKFGYQSLYNHCKKHQAPNAQKLAERRITQIQKKNNGELIQKLMSTADARATIAAELQDLIINRREEWEQIPIDKRATIMLKTLADTDSANAKKKDQDIDIMKMMMPSRSGDVVRGEVLEEEFDPWDGDAV